MKVSRYIGLPSTLLMYDMEPSNSTGFDRASHICASAVLKLLCKDLAMTVSGITEEFAYMEAQLHAEACTGQICYHTRIVAMDACGRTETKWTVRVGFGRNHLNHEQVINRLDGGNL